jgi:hypothetical protein
MKQSRHSSVNRRIRRLSAGKRQVVLTFCVGLPLLIQVSLYSSLLLLSPSVHLDYQAVFASTTRTPSDGDIRPGNSIAAPIHTIHHDQKTNSNLLQGLPDWIQNYIHWHQEQRLKFPANKLFTDPAAPKLLIRTCYGLCGGLHDRLGKLPWDLYLANQTGRVLLMHWCHPAPLQEFLLPNLIDWRVPDEQEIYHNATTCGSTEQVVTDLFDKKMHANRPRADFWTTHLDSALERATTGDYKDTKILRHRILGK